MIRPLAAFAVAVFALGAAAKPAPHAARKAPAKLVDVRAQIVSGNRQDLKAYAATGAAKYVVDFPKLLDVRVSGPQPENGDRIVVFSCVTPGCKFISADQPDEGKHVDHVGALYKVTVIHGRAKLHVTIEGDNPTSEYIVQALPRAHDGERAIPASFTLVMH